MADLQQSILLDRPKEVDVPAIERELTQLWKHAGEETSGGTPVVRACSLNLIIFTEGNERADGLEEIVSQVTVDHPGRIFLVSADRRKATTGVEAWVSARCSLPVPGGKQVCCEEINLACKGTDSNKIPSIVTSLLVPDIPSILIWKAKLDARDNVLQLLSQIVDRVLIDSSEEVHPSDSLTSWGTFIEMNRDRTAFGDLAWTHLIQWRKLLAQAFQPVEARGHLQTIDTVTIEYWSTSKPRHSGLSQSFLATAWLAHALRWVLVHPFKEQGEGEFVAKFRLNEQAVNVRLGQVSPKLNSPGGIASIALRSAQGGEIEYRLMEIGGCIQQRSSLSGMPAVETALSVHHQTEAELVSSELELLHRDALYESSIVLLKNLLTR